MQSLQDRFSAARMDALEAYSLLEWDLSALFQRLLAIPADKAKLIFYRIVNTRARYGIIDDLISIEHPEHKAFWARLEQLLQGCDTKRNHLAHWLGILNVQAETYFLENPVSLLRNQAGALKYDEAAFKAFKDECDFLARIVRNFRTYLAPKTRGDVPQALSEIFLRPPENLKPAAFRQALFDAARQAPPGPLRV